MAEKEAANDIDIRHGQVQNLFSGIFMLRMAFRACG